MAQIVTCRKCGFQTTWASAVDWDDEFECRTCSNTPYGRFINRTPVVKQETALASAKDFHTEHCCSIHGCKYGYEDPDLKHLHGKSCSVESGQKQQSYPCEYCQEAIGTDEPYWATSGWSMWKVDRGEEKE